MNHNSERNSRNTFKHIPHPYRDQDLPWFEKDYKVLERKKTQNGNTIIQDC